VRDHFTTPNLINIVFVSATLGLFYWGIYVSPPGYGIEHKPRLTLEESQELLQQSRIYLREGKHEEALPLAKRLHEERYLEQGVRLAEKYTDYYVVLGSIAEQEGRTEEAVKYYNKVLELDPENRAIAVRRDRLVEGH
jgi:tetratricopeptide (TPR) repeat protein